MNTLAFPVTLQAQDAEGLTFSEMFANVPTDPASIFVYVLVILSIYFVWRGSRGSHGPGPGA
jgi:hypothetical protein